MLLAVLRSVVRVKRSHRGSGSRKRIVDGVYKAVKEAGDDLGLSARQRRELSEQVETTHMTRTLDQHFAKVHAAGSEQRAAEGGRLGQAGL